MGVQLRLLLDVCGWEIHCACLWGACWRERLRKRNERAKGRESLRKYNVPSDSFWGRRVNAFYKRSSQNAVGQWNREIQEPRHGGKKMQRHKQEIRRLVSASDYIFCLRPCWQQNNTRPLLWLYVGVLWNMWPRTKRMLTMIETFNFLIWNPSISELNGPPFVI